MEGNFELYLLCIALLLFLSLLISKAGMRIGVPSLLLFLITGVFFGNYVLDGDAIFLHLHIPQISISSLLGQNIGTIALIIILFSGGFDTKIDEVKPVLVPGLILATVGVILTTVLTALFTWVLTNNLITTISFSFAQALLLSTTVSSTDSASVFGILRSKNLSLKNNIRPILELESGSNDPMAFLTMIIVIQFINVGSSDMKLWLIPVIFLWQLIGGALIGIFGGRLCVKIINKINLDNVALYSVLLLIIAVFIFAFAHSISANGYLAVYLAGLVIGNTKIVHKRSTMKFFEGLTWLFQIVVFLVLGLMVDIQSIIDVAGIGIIIALFIIIVARPISVFLCLMPFKKFTFKSKLFISWVGLRGAVPIIFATYPLTANMEYSQEIFSIVFLITTISLLLQGTTITSFSHLLKLSNPNTEDATILKEFDVEFSDEIKSVMREITITKNMLAKGSQLMDIPLPEGTLVAIVKREDRYFIPRGSNRLEVGDVILIITDNEELLNQTYKQLGVS